MRATISDSSNNRRCGNATLIALIAGPMIGGLFYTFLHNPFLPRYYSSIETIETCNPLLNQK